MADKVEQEVKSSGTEMNTYGQVERKSAELKELSRLEPVSLVIKTGSLHCMTMEWDGTRQF